MAKRKDNLGQKGAKTIREMKFSENVTFLMFELKSSSLIISGCLLINLKLILGFLYNFKDFIFLFVKLENYEANLFNGRNAFYYSIVMKSLWTIILYLPFLKVFCNYFIYFISVYRINNLHIYITGHHWQCNPVTQTSIP